MTFPTELERLLKEATEGPWVVDNNEGFSQWKIWGGMSPSGSGVAGPRIADVIGDSAEADANAELIALLRNHADAILGLVRAAEATEKALKVLTRTYAPEFCEHDRVVEAKRIIEKHGGTLAYLADHIQLLADSRAKLNGGKG